MKRTTCRLLVPPMLLALGVCGVAMAAPLGTRSGHGPASCGPAKARTLASSAEARVYKLHRTVFGCTGQHQFRLSGRHSPVGSVVVVGRLAAYAKYFQGYDFTSASINVESLATGKRLYGSPAFARDNQAEYTQRVGSLVAARDGHVAWIVVSTMLGGSDRVVRVHRGHQVLDSGRAIRPGSLRLHRSVLSWKHGSMTKTASLR